ncbi:C-type lectin domain family 14 member A isoform 1-T1 [Symphorus nematophorus]
MESWFCSYLWMVLVLLPNILADPSSPPRYAIHQTAATFDQAMQNCSRGGVLTTLATEQEVAEILGVVSESFSPLNQKKLQFWVGLRKVKNQCVVSKLPLRGFKWTKDGTEDSQVSRWLVEPQETCTTVLCGSLQVELDGLTVSKWGLIPVTCKNTYQFICKLTGGTVKPPKQSTPAAPEPQPATTEPQLATTEPQPATIEPQHATTKPQPATTEPQLATTLPQPATTAPHQPEPQPATQNPEPTEPEPPTQQPGKDLKPPGSGAAPEWDACQRPSIIGYRSYILDPNNSSRIQVECWSGDPVELHCSGHPAVWRLLDASPANFTTVCRQCDDGFKRDASTNCVDIDECNSGEAHCRHTCLNTEGSFRCICTDKDGKQQDEDSPECTPALSTVLIAVVAVAALLVLVVLVAVAVKCCLMRQSKKRAMKKAEKMAMKNKDDKDSTNEKVSI